MSSNFGIKSIGIGAIVGSLALLNVLAVRAFGRVDVTHDRLYTLSAASRETLSNLDDQVTVSAYFTENLPPPYSSNARYVRDLLEEYRAASKGKLSFEFVDPMSQETAQDKETKKDTRRDIFGRNVREQTSVEKELTQSGIQPVEIRVVEEDQMQTKRAYMGIVLHYQEKKEVIPVVQGVGSLEYDLTSMIRKMTRTKTPIIGILQGHEEPKADEKLRNLSAVLSQTYTLRPIDLGTKEAVDPDVDALLVVGPKTPLKPNEIKAIDQFLMHGKSAGFFLDTVQIDVHTSQSTPADHGLGPLLGAYGVSLGDKLVADVDSAHINVQEQRGFMMVTMPVPYPFIPQITRMEGDSPISKGLGNIAFPFATPVSATAADGRSVVVLARSSPKSWLENKPFNTDPRRDWRSETITTTGPYDLMLQVSGKLTSFFGAQSAPGGAGAAPLLAESQGESRIVVAGTSSLLWDDFASRSQQALALNVADWLALDPAMLAMRTRGLAGSPLKTELAESTRNSAKFGNAFGIPLVLIAFGLIRWRAREARRAQVTV